MILFLTQSATLSDSLVGTFSYKPFDAEVDWSFAVKASPCYMTVCSLMAIVFSI